MGYGARLIPFDGEFTLGVEKRMWRRFGMVQVGGPLLPLSTRRNALLTAIRRGTQDHLSARSEAIEIHQAARYADNSLIQWPIRRPPLLKLSPRRPRIASHSAPSLKA